MRKIYTFLFSLMVITLAFGQLPSTSFVPDESYYRFGTVLSMYGTNFLITDQRESLPGANNKVYLFSTATGSIQQQAVFSPANLSTASRFGTAVSVSDNYAAIGAFAQQLVEGVEGGQVFVYKYTVDGWISHQEISHPDNLHDTKFGKYVKLYGDYLFIAAPNELAAGAVYVYQLTDNVWVFSQRLTGTTDTLFGSKIECNNDRLIISANTNSGVTNFHVYDFNAGVWVPQNEILSTTTPETAVIDWTYTNNSIYAVLQYPDIPLNISYRVEEFAFESGNLWTNSLVLESEFQDQLFTKIVVLGDNIFLGSDGYSLAMTRKFPLLHYKKSGIDWIMQPPMFSIQATYDDDYFGATLAGYGTKLLAGAWREHGDSPSDYGRGYLMDVTLGTKSMQKDELTLYPNPVGEVANIAGSDFYRVQQAAVYSVTGSYLFSTEVTNRQFPTERLSAGLYLVKLTTINGESKTIKLIKK